MLFVCLRVFPLIEAGFLTANTILVHRTVVHCIIMMYYVLVSDYGIRTFKKGKNRFAVINTMLRILVFTLKYMFIGELGGSNRSHVSNTSQQ